MDRRRQWRTAATMYIVTPFPNYVYALDLTKPGAPQKWKYEPKPVPAAQRLPKDRLKTLSNSVLNACTQIGDALGAS